MYRVLLCILFIIPLSAKGQEAPFNLKAVEARIKKHITSSPDSTRIIIDEVLSQKNLHDSVKGYFYNIYGIYYSYMSKEDSALHYYKKSIAILKKYPRIKTRPLMNLSVIYRNRGEYDESFKVLEEALDINKKLGLRVNEAVVYGNMSSNYQFMLDYDKAVEYALKGIAILKRENEPGQLASSNQKLANTYMKMRNFNFAKDMYEECLQIFKSINDTGNHALTLINYAECVIHLGEYDNAVKTLKQAIKELETVKNPEHTAIAYSKLGNIAKLQKRFDLAFRNYNAAFTILSKANSINTVIIAAEYIELLNSQGKYSEALSVIETTRKTPIFKNVNPEDKTRFDIAAAEAHAHTSKNKEAISSLQSAIKLKDSIIKVNRDTYAKELQAAYQKDLQDKKSFALKTSNEALKETVTAEKQLTVLYICGSILMIIVVLLYLRGYWLKNRIQEQELKFIEAENNLTKQEREHEQELISSQKDIIEEKERELVSMALRMANYQDNLNDVINKCDSAHYSKISEIKKELLLLSKQKDYWNQFEKRFNSLHPEFSTALTNRFSKLTKNDIEFCSLLKLNLSNKEIASLLQISHESAITKKYRIKKKMEINDDEEFDKILTEI